MQLIKDIIEWCLIILFPVNWTYLDVDNNLTKLLKEELKLAKQYPQYVVIDEFNIILYNYAFWIKNYPYEYALCTNNIEHLKYINYFLVHSPHGHNNPKPSFWMRIQLKNFVKQYKKGVY